MKRQINAGLAALCFAMILAGCAGINWMPQKTAMVRASEGYEDCAQLDETKTMKLYFESSIPLDFNVHSHVDGEKVLHIHEENSVRWQGEFKPDRDNHYCLQWMNENPTVSQITYGFTVVDRQ